MLPRRVQRAFASHNLAKARFYFFEHDVRSAFRSRRPLAEVVEYFVSDAISEHWDADDLAQRFKIGIAALRIAEEKAVCQRSSCNRTATAEHVAATPVATRRG